MFNSELGWDLLRLEGLVSTSLEEIDGKLFVDEISRAGRGYDLETLRAKALLKYGNVKALTDIYAFNLMSVSAEEQEEILSTTVGHGIDLSTFERDLRADAFW